MSQELKKETMIDRSLNSILKELNDLKKLQDLLRFQ